MYPASTSERKNRGGTLKEKKKSDKRIGRLVGIEVMDSKKGSKSAFALLFSQFLLLISTRGDDNNVAKASSGPEAALVAAAKHFSSAPKIKFG